jgi:hypothetical protein
MKRLLSLVLDVARLAVTPAVVHIPAIDGFGSIEGLIRGDPPPPEPCLGGPPCDPPPHCHPVIPILNPLVTAP